MSYHISTYGYTYKMFGCKRTKLDVGKPYRKEKNKEHQDVMHLSVLHCTQIWRPQADLNRR